MAKEILVIVKNKLMSTDTVLPILIELKEKYNISSVVVVNDSLAHKGINENVVIFDAVNYVGKELYTEINSPSKILRKLSKIKFLLFLLFKLTKGVKVLHFGIFNVFPFSVLGRVFENNLYLIQNSSFKHSYGKFDSALGQNPTIFTPISKNIVAFIDEMKYLNVLNKGQNVFMFGSTRTRRSWVDYIDKRADYYFDLYHKDVDLSNGCIVLVLAFFGKSNQMRLPYDSLRNLLNNTVNVLDDIKGDLPVLIKPHVFTDLDVVNNAIKDLDGFYLTYLHPSVLSSKARVFVCNTYSTTMSDAKSLGVTTVEYSDYSQDILDLSKGNSIGYEYIDKFINNDKCEFKKSIEIILSGKLLSNKKLFYKNFDNDSDKLLAELAK